MKSFITALVYAVAAFAILVVAFDAKAGFINNYSGYQELQKDQKVLYLRGVFDGYYRLWNTDSEAERKYKRRIEACLMDLDVNDQMLETLVTGAYKKDPTGTWDKAPINILEKEIYYLCKKKG